MAYASITHVQALNPQRATYTGSSKPSASQVSLFLDQTSAVIDGVLYKAGYVVPVATDAPTSTLLILQDANAAGGYYKAEWAAAASDKRSEAEDMWQTALKMLAVLELPGVAKNAERSKPRQGPVASPPYFTRDMQL